MSVTDAILREGRPVALAPLPSAIGWREHAVHPVIVADEPATVQTFGDETGEGGGVYVHRDQAAP